jgi:hypothetical protein
MVQKSRMEARENAEEVSNSGKNQSGTARTGNLSEMSSRSGRSTAILIKAEKLALAKLKVTQLKKQHQLERKMTELKFEKEMMEAQMEEECAAVSLIYEPDNEEEQNLDHYEEDRLQLRDGAMNRSGLKSVNPIQISEREIEKHLTFRGNFMYLEGQRLKNPHLVRNKRVFRDIMWINLL